MKKRLLGAFLCLCMVVTMMPSVFAADGSATVTDSNSATVSSNNDIWTLNQGSYTVQGTAATNQSIVIEGDVTLTMSDAVLKHTTTDKSKYAPAISVKSGNTKLILTGTNEVEGSAGYAGIYVAEGASLTISGDGSLTAKGGDGSDGVIRRSSIKDFDDFGFSSEVSSVYFGGGAAIGGGANVDGGIIKISGGIVNATGGHESSGTYGGAGIGGDNGGVTSIEISDGTVTATAGGAAAGIGAGNYAPVGTANEYGDITINGNTVVTAFDGSAVSGSRGMQGGAGIGSGRTCGFGKITIAGTATVRAYAGQTAQAIGTGTACDEDAPNKIEFSKTADVWMFNQDSTDAAFWGQNTDGTLTDDVTTNGANLIWYTGETPAADTATAVSTKDAGLQWKHTTERKVQILKGETVTAEETYAEGYTLGNWAAICEAPKANISYILGEGAVAPDGVTYDPEEVEANTRITTKPAPTKEGYVFIGWKTGDIVYPAGAAFSPSEDTILTAQWQTVEDWGKQPTEGDNTGKLDVSVDVEVNVDVAVEVGVAANVAEDQKAALGESVREILKTAVKGQTPTGMTEDDAQKLQQILNMGGSKIEAELTVIAKLQADPTEEELKTLLGSEMASGETAQIWELSVQLTTTTKDVAGQALGSVEKTAITETAPIIFTLTTGQNFSGKTVRMLYVHNDAVGTAASSVTDAANGVVNVTASKFSPYVILSKVRTSSGGHTSSNTYSVTVKDAANGKLTADRVTAAKGATVTVTAAPDSGYEFGKLTVTDKNGNTLAVTDKGNGKYTFTMPASNVTVTAVFNSAKTDEDPNHAYRDCKKDNTCPIYPFADAKPTAWYHDDVHYCLENKLMVGYNANTFAPSDNTSRAMLSVMLWLRLGTGFQQSFESHQRYYSCGNGNLDDALLCGNPKIKNTVLLQ